MLAVSFDKLSNAVLTLIKELDNDNRGRFCPELEVARRIFIAIENARNIYTQHAPESPTKEEKVKEFNRMIACLKKTDYCRHNL